MTNLKAINNSIQIFSFKACIIIVVFMQFISYTAMSQDMTGTFIDNRDNKTYKWIKIDNNIWMSENINYEYSSNCWCLYNDSINCIKYGRLYTYENALKVCPTDWHLPSKEDYQNLIKYYGSKQNMIDASVNSDSLGLNILLGGWRGYYGDFAFYNDTELWTSSETNDDLAFAVHISKGILYVDFDYGRRCGAYVRCIKNK